MMTGLGGRCLAGGAGASGMTIDTRGTGGCAPDGSEVNGDLATTLSV